MIFAGSDIEMFQWHVSPRVIISFGFAHVYRGGQVHSRGSACVCVCVCVSVYVCVDAFA